MPGETDENHENLSFCQYANLSLHEYNRVKTCANLVVCLIHLRAKFHQAVFKMSLFITGKPEFKGKFRASINFFFFGQNPQCARASSFTRFLDHTQGRTTVGRTPLDE